MRTNCDTVRQFIEHVINNGAIDAVDHKDTRIIMDTLGLMMQLGVIPKPNASNA
jgi:hypothetical protein